MTSLLGKSQQGGFAIALRGVEECPSFSFLPSICVYRIYGRIVPFLVVRDANQLLRCFAERFHHCWRTPGRVTPGNLCELS